MTQSIPFIKMHGIGNDFVVMDLQRMPLSLTPPLITRICNRHTGIGCDQLVTLAAATQPEAAVLVRFYNPDGSESGACGNATRCVAHYLMQQGNTTQVTLQTAHGLLACAMSGDQVMVNMGQATVETLHLTHDGITDGVAVSIGNPHLILAVDDVDAYPVAQLGTVLEHHALFPQRVNVNFVQVLDRHSVKLRVWERGAGETLACGSGACATAVAAFRRGWTGHHVRVQLPGGELNIDVNEDNTVYMTGSVAYVFAGTYQAEYDHE